jgi:hypothetical protein
LRWLPSLAGCHQGNAANAERPADADLDRQRRKAAERHSRHQQLLASTGRIIDAHYTVDAACLVRSNVVTPVTPRFVAAG